MGPPPWEMDITGARGIAVVLFVESERRALRLEEKRKGESGDVVGGKAS